MTPWQIISVLTCGPLAIMLFLNGALTIMGRSRRDLDLPQVFVLILCIVLITISFVGVS